MVKKYSDDFKKCVVREYYTNKEERKNLLKKYNISNTTLKSWCERYNKDLVIINSNMRYIKDNMYKIINEYLNGRISRINLCRKYNITTKILYLWLRRKFDLSIINNIQIINTNILYLNHNEVYK